ncbi:hypothetical protein TorRG33x02_260250, partial [Trema orientale]
GRTVVPRHWKCHWSFLTYLLFAAMLSRFSDGARVGVDVSSTGHCLVVAATPGSV